MSALNFTLGDVHFGVHPFWTGRPDLRVYYRLVYDQREASSRRLDDADPLFKVIELYINNSGYSDLNIEEFILRML